MRLGLFIILTVFFVFTISSPALAAWPAAGSQGDQYGELNAIACQIAAEEGIACSTFIAIYNAAAANQLFADLSGSVSQRLALASPLKAVYAALSGSAANRFTQDEVDASCRVLTRLASFKSKLADYDTVFNNLSCGARPVAAAGAPARGKVPNTGLAIALLAGSGAVGIGAGIKLLKKSR